MKNLKLNQMPLHQKCYDFCVDMTMHVVSGGGVFKLSAAEKWGGYEGAKDKGL